MAYLSRALRLTRWPLPPFGKKTYLVEKFSTLQMGKATVKWLFGHLGNRLKQGKGQLRTNDRSGLQESFFSCGNRSIRAASVNRKVAIYLAQTGFVGQYAA